MTNLVTMLQQMRATLGWAVAALAENRLANETLVPVPVRNDAFFKKVSPVALAVALLASAGTSQASRSAEWDDTADGRLVDVQIEVDGEAAPLYWAPGRWDRRYIEAFAGRNYAIVLRNNSARRIGVLMTVDGLNVVNGERSRLSSGEPMYVLDPWEQTTIRGWRSSLNDVRRFVFVDERRSYAERTGQANSDMGWIRVLSFREKQSFIGRLDSKYREPSFRDGERRRDSNEGQDESEAAPQARAEEAPAPNATLPKRGAEKSAQGYADGAPAPGGSFPGTGWGDRQIDPVRRVTFRPEHRATDQLVFRYEYASALHALGIETGRRWRDRLYDRDGDVGFAQPPRRW